MDNNNFNKLVINYDINNLTYPKIIFSFKKQNYNIFFYEWFKFIDFFNKCTERLDSFILKCLIRDYYSEDGKVSVRELISKLVLNLNLHLFDMIHIEYFNNFEDCIKRFKFLKLSVNNTSIKLNNDKKETFIYYLVFFMEILEEIKGIFNFNFVSIKNTSAYENLLFYYEDPIDFKFIPIAGNKLIKSFEVSKNLITNYQFLYFVKSGGYKNSKYWSPEGFYWIKYFKINYPKGWICIKNDWYIDQNSITSIYNCPITNISFYEAEACARFYKCQIQTEEQRDWIFTNRNKTNYPTGIDLPIRLDIFKIEEPFSVLDESYISLMGINQLFGNVWEYTKTVNLNNEVIIKGGDHHTPSFIINTELKMIINKSLRKNNIGFRLVRF